MPWFGLPKRSEYILRSLICIARSKSRLPVRAIAACEDIPTSFLAQILYQLTWHGLVNSKRGPKGGFALARPPEQIRLRQVLEIFHVPLGHLPDSKPGHAFSQTWEKLWEPPRQMLETLTLADLLDTEPAPSFSRNSVRRPIAPAGSSAPGPSAKEHSDER